MKDLPNKLKNHLEHHPPEIKTEWDVRLAAILIPLFYNHGQWHVVYTRRTDHLDTHQGQVSFPGGAVETHDISPQVAALRETEEEIGIPAGQIDVLGRLDSLLTVTQFQIIPIVGLIPWPVEMQINSVEVARVFSVPLCWLADEKNLEVQKREFRLDDRPVKVYFYKPYEDEIIWGATARLTLNLISELRAIGYE